MEHTSPGILLVARSKRFLMSLLTRIILEKYLASGFISCNSSVATPITYCCTPNRSRWKSDFLFLSFSDFLGSKKVDIDNSFKCMDFSSENYGHYKRQHHAQRYFNRYTRTLIIWLNAISQIPASLVTALNSIPLRGRKDSLMKNEFRTLIVRLG